jgi:hypothetical protein
MSGTVLNRGGVRVEFNPDTDKPAFAWSAKMRNHQGFGESPAAAFDDVIAQITDELNIAKAAKKTYSPDIVA